MSLFAAFATKGPSETSCTEKTDAEKPSWLENSSAQEISECLENSNLEDVSSDNGSDEDLQKKNVSEVENVAKIEGERKRKRSKHKKETCEKSDTCVKGVYFKDTERNKRFCIMETLDRSIRPSYSIFDKGLGFVFYCRRKAKNVRYRRYYKVKSIKEDQHSTSKVESLKSSIHLVNSANLDVEKLRIKQYNQTLALNPNDIQTWIEYITFQDETQQVTTFQSEREEMQQLVRQKKMSIVEKALTLNKDSVDLAKIKLKILSESMPVDEYAREIEIMIQKDPSNELLWNTLVTVMRESCALFKISRITNCYEKMFAVFKRNTKTNCKLYDKQVLALLYQCLMILRHAGLWEQMWEIIKMNLCLNLDVPQEAWKNIKTLDEKIVTNMEEVVLSSELPLNELWLKIESLRECCHWIGLDATDPVVDLNLLGDEKRLVSSEETAIFIHPLISSESNFRLAIISMVCLKVPLLPCRDSALRDFNFDDWTRDSLEFILPMIYPCVGVGGVLDDRFSTVTRELLQSKLTAGPPLANFHPAQEAYLDFIRCSFDQVAQGLPPLQRTSILVWWLRLERLLIYMSKHEADTQSARRDKKCRSAIKSFFKKPENRENVYFYREYALIQLEWGSLDDCLETLRTVLESQEKDKGAIMSCFATAFQVAQTTVQKQPFVDLLRDFLSTDTATVGLSITEILYNEILYFLKDPPTDESEDALFLPNWHCDLTTCWAHLNSGDCLDDVVEMLDRCIARCDECPRIKERFVEAKIDFLKRNDNVSWKMIHAASTEFPNNFFLTSLNAILESQQPLWKISTTSKNSNVASILARCCAARLKIAHAKSIGCLEGYTATINKMLSFHAALSKSNCPLVWKFYMLLIQEANLSAKMGEEVFYKAISQCPWNKSVYTNAADIAPQLLSQIQDLIQERELRVHSTVEEIAILK